MADTWIYTYGDVSTLEIVFNYLATLRSDSNYLDLIYLSLFIGGLLAVTVKRALGIMGFGIYFGGATTIIALLFGTTTSVNIVNVKVYDNIGTSTGSTYARVDNVPYLFAQISSAFSTIGYYSALGVENGFNSVGGNDDLRQTSFIKSGPLGPSRLLSNIETTALSTISTSSSIFTKHYNEYLETCIFNIAALYKSETLTIIQTSQNPLASIDPVELNTNPGINIGNEVVTLFGSSTTCQVGYDQVVNDFDAFFASNDIPDYYKAKLGNDIGDVVNTLGAAANMYSQSTGSSSQKKLKNFVLSMGLMKNTNAAFESFTGSHGSSASMMAGNFGAGMAEANLIIAGKTNSAFAPSMLPNMQSVIQAFMYIVFPLIFVIQLAIGGFKLFQNYVQALIWIELWPTTFSVLTFFVEKDIQTMTTDRLVAAGGHQHDALTMLTMSNLPEIANGIAQQSAIAAQWYWMVPMLSGFIIYGSLHALQGIGTQMMSYGAQSGNIEEQSRKQSELNLENEMRGNPLYDGYSAGDYWQNNNDMSHAQSSMKAMAAIEQMGGVGKGSLGGAARQTFENESRNLEGIRANVENTSNNDHFQASTKKAADLVAEANVAKNNTFQELTDASQLRVQTEVSTANKTIDGLGGDINKTAEKMSDTKSADSIADTKKYDAMPYDRDELIKMLERESQYSAGVKVEAANKVVNDAGDIGNAIEKVSNDQSLKTTTSANAAQVVVEDQGGRESAIVQQSTSQAHQVKQTTADNVATEEALKAEAKQEGVDAEDKRATLAEAKAKDNLSLAEGNAEHVEGKTVDELAKVQTTKRESSYGASVGEQNVAEEFFGGDVAAMNQKFKESELAIKNGEVKEAFAIAERETGLKGLAAASEFASWKTRANQTFAGENGETETKTYAEDGSTGDSKTSLNKINEEKTVIDTSETKNSSVTSDSSHVKKDNHIVEQKKVHDTSMTHNSSIKYDDSWITDYTTSVVNGAQVYKRVGDDFEQTMNNNAFSDGAKSAATNPQDLYAVAKRYFYESEHNEDRSDKVNFQPDTTQSGQIIPEKDPDFFKK